MGIRKVASGLFGFLALCAPALLPACGGTEFDTESAAASESQELAAERDFTYYLARTDFRRCAFPLCGGFWVQRVNHATMKCSDGSEQAECYVAEIDASAVSPEGAAASSGNLFRAVIRRKSYGDQGKYGVLVASEAWVPGNPTQAPDGTFYRVTTGKTDSYHQSELNVRAEADISSVDLDAVNAPEGIVGAMTAIEDASLLVAGTHQSDPPPGGTLVASQFYLPYGTDCRINGCARGDYCTFCFFSYTCIPDGAVC